MSRQIISTTRPDGTRSTYALQPGSTALVQMDALKPLKPPRMKADRRTYPKYKPGMSTAEYVALYEAANNGGLRCADFWQTLNTKPAESYAGIDSVEHGDFFEDATEDAGRAEIATPAPVIATPAPAPAPQVKPSALQAWRAAANRAGVEPVATETEADSMADACADRFGSSDPMSCVHLAAFPEWHRAALAEIPDGLCQPLELPCNPPRQRSRCPRRHLQSMTLRPMPRRPLPACIPRLSATAHHPRILMPMLRGQHRPLRIAWHPM